MILGAVYINKKTQQPYRALDIAENATNAANGQKMVIYGRADLVSNLLFVREIGEFLEKFEKLTDEHN